MPTLATCRHNGCINLTFQHYCADHDELRLAILPPPRPAPPPPAPPAPAGLMLDDQSVRLTLA